MFSPAMYYVGPAFQTIYSPVQDRGFLAKTIFRFWRALEAEASDAMFPLRLVEILSADSFNPPLFAALCSANLVQALQRLAKYKQLVAPMSPGSQYG